MDDDFNYLKFLDDDEELLAAANLIEGNSPLCIITLCRKFPLNSDKYSQIVSSRVQKHQYN